MSISIIIIYIDIREKYVKLLVANANHLQLAIQTGHTNRPYKK